MCVSFCFIITIVCDLNVSNKNNNLEVFKTFEFQTQNLKLFFFLNAFLKFQDLTTACYVMVFRLGTLQKAKKSLLNIYSHKSQFVKMCLYNHWPLCLRYDK